MTAVKSNFRFSYFPLWLWATGYTEFLLNTLVTPIASLGSITVVAGTAILFITILGRRANIAAEAISLLRELRTEFYQNILVGIFFIFCLILFFVTLGLGFFSATRPPHLPQEYDAIHYQMGLPRQLLLRGNLGWINWSAADLWPMAMQWGMAPLSLAFSTVNKLPQFIATCGIAASLYRIAEHLQPTPKKRLLYLLPVFGFFSAHGVMIQLGTGMMDLSSFYFLVCALLAFLEKSTLPSALSLAVYAASKAFHPIHVVAVVGTGILWLSMSGRLKQHRKFLLLFISILAIFSGALLARSVAHSTRFTGTPLFPFLICTIPGAELCDSASRNIIEISASEHIATRDRYGDGRTISGFFSHLLFVGVPTKGVNNNFDYPLGLPWYLLLIFLAFSLRRKPWKSPIFALCVLFWALWWMSSQQSRWLYPTLGFGLLATLAEQDRAYRSVAFAIAVSFTFSILSQARSILPTLNLSAVEIQNIEKSKVKWAEDGITILTNEMLYLEKPAIDHLKGSPQWILR